MARDKSRSLQWGKGNRPTSTSSLGAPIGSQGSDGDIEIRQTLTGAKLFAKVSGRWYSAPLQAETEAVPVLTHYFNFTMEAEETDDVIELPNFIPPGSIVGISFFANHSGDYWHVYEWKDNDDDVAEEKHHVLYNRTEHRIEVKRMGSQIDDGKTVKIVLFYVIK